MHFYYYLDPSWKPAEDRETIVNERTWLAGMLLAAVAYGIVFTLFILSFKQLIMTTTRKNYISNLPFIIYISLMFIFGTLFVGANAKMTQLSFIDARLFPGGPANFEKETFSIPIAEISNVVYVLANWFADGMVVLRCMVVYKSCRYPWWAIMCIPFLAYLTSVSLGLAWLIQLSSPRFSPWTSTTVNFTAPYFWMSLSLNIAMTIAICARLLLHRWQISRVLGPMHGTHYISVAAIMVESAFLYSAFALLFLVPFALNNPIQNSFIQVLGEVQIIATFLITYRLAYGNGWGVSTSSQLFDKDPVSNSILQFSVPQELCSNNAHASGSDDNHVLHLPAEEKEMSQLPH